MIIYKAGSSLANELVGLNSTPNTYYCQSDTYQNKKISDEFNDMLKFLTEDKDLVLSNIDPATYTVNIENGDTYKLCKEKVFTSWGRESYKTSVISKAINEELFTKNMVYQNEDGSIVYMHNRANYDIANRELHEVDSAVFYKTYSSDPKLLESILKYYVIHNFTYGASISSILDQAIPMGKMNAAGLLEKLFAFNANKTLKIIHKHDALSYYLLDKHRLSLDVQVKENSGLTYRDKYEELIAQAMPQEIRNLQIELDEE